MDISRIWIKKTSTLRLKISFCGLMKNMKRIESEKTLWLIILISRKVQILMRSYTCNFLFFRKLVSNLSRYILSTPLSTRYFKTAKTGLKTSSMNWDDCNFFLWPIKSKVQCNLDLATLLASAQTVAKLHNVTKLNYFMS